LDQLQLNASIMRKFNYKIPIEFSGGGVKSEEMDCDETPREKCAVHSDVHSNLSASVWFLVLHRGGSADALRAE
jgi:hypothetical protein